MAAGYQNDVADLAPGNGEGGEGEPAAGPPRPENHPAEEQRQGDVAAARVHNWQASKPTVKERLAFLFNNDILSDVRFIVGKDPNKQIVPAHKFVLAIGSTVFDTMFNGVLPAEADAVELPDDEAATFLRVLKFLYSDEVGIDPENVMATLYAARKFGVRALEERCVEFLKATFGINNALLLLAAE